MDVVKKVEEVGTAGGSPKQRVEITSSGVLEESID